MLSRDTNKNQISLYWLLILSTLISFHSINAQDETIVIKSGQSVAQGLPKDKMYRYPGFLNGVAHLKDKTIMLATMNYNFALADMMFIGDRRDTLVFTDRDVIDFVVMSKDTFFTTHQGYFEHLEGNKNIDLLMRQYLKLLDIKKEGAYGTSNSNAAIDNYSSTMNGMNFNSYKLKTEQELEFAFRSDYYFRKQDGDFMVAKKNNLIKMFPEYKDAINKFLKENSTRFNKKEDLIRLTAFMSDLK